MFLAVMILIGLSDEHTKAQAACVPIDTNRARCGQSGPQLIYFVAQITEDDGASVYIPMPGSVHKSNGN